MNTFLNTFFIRNVVRSEKGSMLLISLIITSVFVVFSTGYLGMVAVEASSTEKAYRSALALHIAESGVEEAIWEFNYGGSDFTADEGWTGTDPKVKTNTLTTEDGVNLGQYTVTVSDPTGASPVLSAVGSAYSRTSVISEQRSIEVTWESPTPGSYTMAAFAETNIEMASNACMDSFNSDIGPYSTHPTKGTNFGSNGDIGTNSTGEATVTLDSNATISGDAYVGVGGSAEDVIDAAEDDAISGSQEALGEAVAIESVTGPEGLTDHGSVLYDDGDEHMISSSGQYTNLTIDGRTTLTLSGTIKIYVTGTFLMDSNTDLNIAEGADVELYVDGALILTSNTTVNNNTMDPSKLKIYGTDSLTDGDDGSAGIKFNSNADIYATIQAKNSTVELDSNVGIYGGVKANKIVMKSNTCIHYDEALANDSGGGSEDSSNGAIVLWQEK